MVWQLAEKFYNMPGLFDCLNRKCSQDYIYPKSIDLGGAQLEGKVDYCVGDAVVLNIFYTPREGPSFTGHHYGNLDAQSCAVTQGISVNGVSALIATGFSVYTYRFQDNKWLPGYIQSKAGSYAPGFCFAVKRLGQEFRLDAP